MAASDTRNVEVVASRIPVLLRLDLERHVRREGGSLSRFIREAIEERLERANGREVDERQT